MNTQRVAIITAASRGIGAGCARELAARGYKVSLIARNHSIFDLAAELGGIATQGSIANAEDLQQLDAKFISGTTLKVDEAYSAAI